ncbi:SDR family oxidoreductase [Actinomadura sp. LD22]|uniref:SDR family oxidoreductase n=1 Tax=Actinomadura physcomitrii TaxID=2650748 RepID=A0A6I4M320_9ACTN|nr:SDR family oxidoreductase [Actinomadura physcomitrii]MVZ99841.1 SDR family oxidoreductase [Actinomadura physcomitrii]
METIVVTGAATGIGASTAERWKAGGHRVIGVGLADCEANADLSEPGGRARAVSEILDLAGGVVDGHAACAGLSRNSGDERKIIAVNFFGAFEPLLALRKALSRGDRPGVALVSSSGMLRPWGVPGALKACLEMDEPGALEAVAADPRADGPFAQRPAYATSKSALGPMARRLAWQTEWTGAGITINVVAPGVTKTPTTDVDFATPEGEQRLLKAAPSPMNRIAEADEAADPVAYFAEGRARFVTGQVVFVDGGLDARRRPDDPILPLDDDRWV